MTTTTTTSIKLARRLRAAGITCRYAAHILSTVNTAHVANVVINTLITSPTARAHAWGALYSVHGATMPGESWWVRTLDDRYLSPIGVHARLGADAALEHTERTPHSYRFFSSRAGSKHDYMVTRDMVTPAGVERESHNATYEPSDR